MIPRIMDTFSCAQVPAVSLLGAWCIMGGHWRITRHALRNRAIGETVLIACVEGRGWLQLGGLRFVVGAGDIFCCPAGTVHSYGCEKGGWEIYWTHCQGAQVAALCEAAGLKAATPVRAFARHPQVRADFAALIQGMAVKGAGTPWLAGRNLFALLHGLVWLHHNPARPRTLADLASVDIGSLDDMVRASGYSRFHFCRRFKQETGQTPWHYLLERKMERAKELLLGSQLSIKEIAGHLGFANPDYFARLFRRNSGVTPRRYRGRGDRVIF